jgi:hypothetical protein
VHDQRTAKQFGDRVLLPQRHLRDCCQEGRLSWRQDQLRQIG